MSLCSQQLGGQLMQLDKHWRHNAISKWDWFIPNEWIISADTVSNETEHDVWIYTMLFQMPSYKTVTEWHHESLFRHLPWDTDCAVTVSNIMFAGLNIAIENNECQVLYLTKTVTGMCLQCVSRPNGNWLFCRPLCGLRWWWKNVNTRTNGYYMRATSWMGKSDI